ncbi:Glycosyltransferase involved in cell wall bisynthesis [Algoriphagus locisalis]|uniref:Glycosyltransferase involved in cell wall bisynthesis n=1 Tax=Algoriphagus locisalis TaxID=305507 RepID=A0A1I6XU54_9BACT|nr:glycosyltransferase [Algoriphagus locisalis]SFT41999.1 Glycosyltransferase involved in cell wall bisynthesis [Algoriphagus locisalis]
MIRVLHCIETIASGGVEQVRLTLVRGLDRSKFEHKIICTWGGGAIADAFEAEGVELVQVGSFTHPFEVKKHRKVLEVIRKFKPHIIHGAIFEGMSMAAIAGAIGAVPVRILEETSEPTGRSKKSIWLQRLFLRFSDKIVGISPSVVQFLAEKAKLPDSKIILINNGVTIPESAPPSEIHELKEKLGFKEEDFIIGSVGRVYDQVKRFSDILKALKILNDPNFKLLVIGDGPDLASLKELSETLGISKQVVFTGHQANPHPFFGTMDIFCIASAHEGFGLVAAEAMMHGLPVIATKVGGLKDVVKDENSGFLTPPFSPNQIAEKIKILASDPELRNTMGQKGRARALENYSAERYCKEIETLYVDLLATKGISVLK